MRKIIAFVTALAALSCTLTACGSKDDSSTSTTTAASSTSASESGTGEDNSAGGSDSTVDGTEDVTASSEVQTGTSMEASTEPEEELNGHIVGDDAPYMNDLKDMIDCLNNKKFVEYISYMYPTELLNAALEAQGNSMEDMAKQMAEGMEKEGAGTALPVKLGKVAEYDESDDLVKQMREGFDEAMNGSTADSDELSKQLGFDLMKYIEMLKDCKVIDVEMLFADGKSEVATFMAYEADGEGWKFDVTMLSMLTYVKKSKQSSLNSNAATIDKAALSSITDMDAKSGFPSGKFVLGENKSLDVNVPDGVDTDELRSSMKNYFDKLDDLNYFVVIKDVDVVKVVCKKKDSDEYIGIYPADSSNTKTYEELYKLAKNGGLYDDFMEPDTE